MLNGANARCVVFGCLNLATGHRVFLARRRYRGWHVTLVLDGDRSHDAEASQALAQRRPKRAPELNPMDTLWGQGKDAICANKRFTAIDEQVASFLDHVSNLL